MSYNPENPLIIQSDRTILLEVHSPKAEAAREAIATFAELIKSPEHIHTYRLTPLSIWNARAVGLEVDAMLAALQEYAKYPVPEAVNQEIEALGRRYGLTRIERSADGFFLLLKVADEPLAELLIREEPIAPLLDQRLDPVSFQVNTGFRGLLKKALVEVGYPAEDLAGYVRGDALPLKLSSVARSGQPFILRNYQREAAEVFYQSGRVQGGSGVICLPCGAGKTIVGMAATLWQVGVTEAADRLELFWNDALLLPVVIVRIGTKEWATYRIHDLLHDLAIKWLTKEKSPGLGLTIPQAHSILLERYQANLDDENWHELVDDGYIYDHLTWHLEKADYVNSIHQLLQEETSSGKNGWHSKCEALGKTAIFVGDVARAWKLAEEDYQSNPTKAIGLQCRYSLIISSLNTIAGNIPPELISGLVEKKVWTPAQGLAYCRQVQSLSQRVKALSKLGLYFPEIWSEALEAALNIKDEFARAVVLRNLAPYLPENLLSQALESVFEKS